MKTNQMSTQAGTAHGRLHDKWGTVVVSRAVQALQCVRCGTTIQLGEAFLKDLRGRVLARGDDQRPTCRRCAPFHAPNKDCWWDRCRQWAEDPWLRRSIYQDSPEESLRLCKCCGGTGIETDEDALVIPD